MPSLPWNPQQYLSAGGHRLRAASDLLAHVPSAAPARIADLGCGPGNATALLAARWPEARLLGVDGSAEMLERARREGPAAEWLEADVASWTADAPFDVIYSNAALHWLDDHESLFPRLFGQLAPGGALAVQMPRNFEAPSHLLARETAREGPWAEALEGALLEEPVAGPAFYYALLEGRSATLDIWETTYQHVLEGADPVLEWTKGSALLPVRERLDDRDFEAFTASYAAKLRTAYPPQPDGKTLFAFKRLFMVALAPG